MPRTAPDRGRFRLSRSGAGGLFRSVLVFSVFTNLLMLTGPLYMMQIYDRVLGSRSEETLVALTALMAGLFLLYGVLEYARGRVMARAAARVGDASADRVFRASLEARAKAPRSGVGATALDDLAAIRTFVASPTLLAILDMPWTPLFLAAIFLFHPLLGTLALLGGTTLIAATALNQVLTQSQRQDADGHAERARRLAQDAASGAGLAWAQGMIGALSSRWRAHLDASTTAAMTAQDRSGGFTAFSKAFRFFLQSAILALGAWLVLQGALTAGAMIAASILLGRALAPIEQAIGQWSLVQRARVGNRRLTEFLEAHPEPPPQTALPRPEATLSARNLGVATSRGQPPLLSGISFDLGPGEALGVIGKSGAGKSTLARVVTGLILPATGEVRLGGATLAQYEQETLGTHIGYLPQEVHLFEGTVAENIAGMAETPDALSVVAAARQARVHEIILRLPDGYDTRLSTSDPCFSGGQKQRIALARALYGDPVLLVLDEPNSALDSDGSQALNAAIDAVKARRGAVMVMTHRPTAIASCDRLLLIDQGRTAAYGPRDEVVRSKMQNSGAIGKTLERTGT